MSQPRPDSQAGSQSAAQTSGLAQRLAGRLTGHLMPCSPPNKQRPTDSHPRVPTHVASLPRCLLYSTSSLRSSSARSVDLGARLAARPSKAATNSGLKRARWVLRRAPARAIRNSASSRSIWQATSPQEEKRSPNRGAPLQAGRWKGGKDEGAHR